MANKKSRIPPLKAYEAAAKARLATKAKTIGKEPSPPPLVKPLNRGGK